MLSNTLNGTFTTGAAETTKVIDTGSKPYQINLVNNAGTLMASYVDGITVASIKGTFAATFTVGVNANGLYGVTIGGLANSTAYTYVIIK
jgi:hypothetical protein